ncbi:MAG: BatA domain-containing protein [Candidatus Omnitrophica bacterium]|nr:BatA domain-containing protein [Candidatus Omnitrophota bacterium]
MFFLNPTFLLGLFGLSLPVMIHLIARRKHNQVVFGSLRFLHESQRRVGRAFNIRQMLLLILRVLILTALVLSFARPLSTGSWLGSWLGAQERQVVLIIDSSCSMDARSLNDTFFQRAKTISAEIVNALHPGSSIALIAFHKNAQMLTPGWTRDRAEAFRILDSLENSTMGTNLASAFSLLPGLLESAGPGTREIFVLSDMQRCGWEHVDRQRYDDADLRILFIDCNDGRAPDAAVENVDVTITSTLRKAPARLSAQICNYSGVELQPTCSLILNDQKRDEQRIFIPAGGRAEVLFEFSAEGMRHLKGAIELSPDGWSWNNRRYFYTQLPDEIPVVIVDSTADSIQAKSYFLQRALSPPGSSISIIQPRVVQALNPDHLHSCRAVIFADLQDIPREEWILDWIGDGGAAYVFAADAPLTESILFGDIRVRSSAQAGNEAMKIARTHDMDEAIAQMVFQAEFYQTAALEADFSNPLTDAFAWFQDGRPAILQHRWGKGNITVLAIPCGRHWTEFPLQPGYLPFLHEILALGQNSIDGGFLTGDSFRFLIERTQTSILTPDNEDIIWDSQNHDVPPIAERPGFYRFTEIMPEQRGESYAAVNIDAAEFNPEKISLSQIKEKFPGARMIPSSNIQEDSNRQIGVSDWTDLILLLTIGLIFLEFYLAGRFAVPKQSESGREKPAWMS